MNIRDPKESNFYPWEKGGTGVTREEAKLSSVIQEIWSVADFVVDTDPAVCSYLDGNDIIDTTLLYVNMDSERIGAQGRMLDRMMPKIDAVQ